MIGKVKHVVCFKKGPVDFEQASEFEQHFGSRKVALRAVVPLDHFEAVSSSPDFPAVVRRSSGEVSRFTLAIEPKRD